MNPVLGLVVPGMPHPLLAPDQNPHWAAIRDAYAAAREQILASGAEALVMYSTGWPSVIGHQIQADPTPEWVHVDHEWHDLGSIPYRFRIDVEVAKAWEQAANARGLHARTVAYRGFPIDTGTVVALKLLNPDNRLLATVASCNMYADRAETLVLGKAARDAVERTGRKVAAVAITALSNRIHTRPVAPADDRISSLKDDEWNRKLLEILGEGRLEDASQLARTFSAQAHADSKMKALWWLAAFMGQHNRYQGTVHAYGPIMGTGAAVVTLLPSERSAAEHEFDEEDVEVFTGERAVLGEALEGSPGQAALSQAPAPAPVKPAAPAAPAGAIHANNAPKPVGAYPHARRVGDLLYLSGVGPRQPHTHEIPGGPVRDAAGPRDYSIEKQTRATIENVRRILEESGSSLEQVLDVTVFLIDMDRDFNGYNKVYSEYFTHIGATRTTLAVSALPTPIAVEFKVIAAAGKG